MKKNLSVLAFSFLALVSFSGCNKNSSSKVIKVGATPRPHAELLNLVKDDLKENGYDLQVVEFTDYVTPNKALEDGEIDANFFQHLPYMNSFNKELLSEHIKTCVADNIRNGNDEVIDELVKILKKLMK